MSEKHPLDIVAERLEAVAAAPVAAQDASPDYWELHASTDAAVVGDYPQAVSSDPGVVHGWGESGGLGPDGFPAVEIPEQVLQEAARRTDVMSANLWDQAFLFNAEALAAFKRCELGNFREYPAVVRDHDGVTHAVTYLHFRNVVPPAAIDFGRSEFYLADMVGKPQGPVAVGSFGEWEEKVQRARKGQLDGCEKFSKLVYKRLFFLPGHAPSADLFTLARLSVTVYVSARLKDAVERSGVTGLEFKPNRRLFANR